MKKNLYIATILNKEENLEKDKKKIVYIVGATMMTSFDKLVKELSVDEEVEDIKKISEECYV